MQASHDAAIRTAVADEHTRGLARLEEVMLSHERIVSSRVAEAVEAAHSEERARAQLELERLHDVHTASLQACACFA